MTLNTPAEYFGGCKPEQLRPPVEVVNHLRSLFDSESRTLFLDSRNMPITLSPEELAEYLAGLGVSDADILSIQNGTQVSISDLTKRCYPSAQLDHAA